MPSWTGKTRGGVIGYKIFVFIISHLGLAFAYFLLRFVLVYFLLTSPRALKAAYRYYRQIHHFGRFKAARYLYRSYYVFGQTLIDKLCLLSGHNKKLSFQFDGEHYLRDMADHKTGGMLMSAHIGSFEIAGYLLKRIPANIHVLMFEAEHARIKSYLNTVYKGLSTNIISLKPDMSHVYELRQVFDRREILCLHGDRFLEGSKTITRDFMGYPSRFPAGPFYLAMKYDVPVSFVFAVKTGKYHYKLSASAPKSYFQGSLNLGKRPALAAQIADDYIASLEEVLRKHPEQWFNFYDFWRV